METEMDFRAGVLCGCVFTVPYGVHCTRSWALTYTCTHSVDERTPFSVLFALLLCRFISSCLWCYSLEHSLGRQCPPRWKTRTSSNEAGACSVAPLCTFLLGGEVFPLVQGSDSAEVQIVVSRIVSVHFSKVLLSKAHGGRRWPCCLDDNQMPVQNMSIHQCSTALPPISQDKRF